MSERTFEYHVPDGPHLRLTVATCNVLELGRYSSLRAAAVEDFRAATGLPPWEAPADANPEQWQLLDIGLRRAYLLACTRKYEERGEDGETWLPWQKPLAWETVAGFAQAVDAQLYLRWIDEVLLCNPGMFVTDDSEAGKADGGGNATA